MLTLKQVRYLTAVSKHRHFARAAEACSVTQPALSMQISDLEDKLGVQLVVRDGGPIQLTAEGAEVVRRCEIILKEVKDIEDFARYSGRGLSGSMTLGVIPTIGPYLLPSVLPKLFAKYDRLDLRIRETQTSVLVEELAQGQIDVALLALPIVDKRLTCLPLFSEPFLYAVKSDSPDAIDAPLQARMIPGADLLLLEEGHCLRDQALSFCTLARKELLNSLGATSLSTLLQMVSCGMGQTVVPRLAINREFGADSIFYREFADPAPKRDVGLVWRKQSPRADAFRTIGKLFQQCALEDGADALPKAV